MSNTPQYHLTIIGVTRVKNMAALELYSLRMGHSVCGVSVTGARVSRPFYACPGFISR